MNEHDYCLPSKYKKVVYELMQEHSKVRDKFVLDACISNLIMLLAPELMMEMKNTFNTGIYWHSPYNQNQIQGAGIYGIFTSNPTQLQIDWISRFP